jgi:uncharacterized coiled-coil protein SlyX
MPERSQDETKIQRLEIALAHQQRLCEQLNEVVYQHTKQLLELQRTISNLEGHVRELRNRPKDAPSEDPLQERPPHY